MMAESTIEASGFPPGFHTTLGQFHCMWLMFDVTVDYSIGRLLNIGTGETHVLVAGMEFGRKLRLLVELLKRSNWPNRSLLLEAVRKLQGSKREMITHAYVASDDTHITFIYRARGEYFAKKLEYSASEFKDHVASMILASQKYQRALGAPMEDLIAFAEAALSVSKS
jgi:hypothetical protein